MNRKTNRDVNDLTDKILKGIDLAYRRLVESKAKDNQDLVFSENGKVIHVKAKTLL